MIYIKYDNFSLEVWGHANSAEYGKDLVCCAVSSLTYALEAHLMRHDEYRGVTTRNPVDAAFKATARPKLLYDNRCREVFETVMDGLRLLARNYPDNITIIERGNDNGGD